MTYPFQTSQNLAKRRRRRGGRLALLAMSSYGVLVVGRASSGCGDTCGHDFQCDRGQICIPYEGDDTCVVAPTCLLDTDCDDGTRCKLRSKNFVNDEPRDPFTVDAPGRLTCGGYAGPKQIGEGCGSVRSNDTGGGFDGSGETSSSMFSTGSSTGNITTAGGTTASTGGTTASAGGSTASTGGGTTSSATGSGP